MTLALRAHHLLCLLTYAGTGYSRAFVDNFDAVVARLAVGEAFVLVHGPDDICAPLCAAEGDCAHCYSSGVAERDRRAAQNLLPLLAPPADGDGGRTLDAATLARLRPAFASGRIRGACAGCEWADLCSRVADGGFAGVRLAGSGRALPASNR